MRVFLIAAVLTLVAAVATAQTDAGPSNEQKYNEKLKKPFVSKVTWVRGLEAAKQRAKDEKRLVFGYFTRSYSP